MQQAITFDNYKIVHHINGEKLDNRLDNLCLTNNESEHQNLHKNLETMAMQMVKEGFILFDHKLQSYHLNYSKLYNSGFGMSLGFENVAIIQKKNLCKSRLDAQISSEIIRGIHRPNPLIAANMSTVINASFYKKLYDLGSFAILHRAKNKEEYIQEVKEVAEHCEWVAAAIGIADDQYDLAKNLVDNGCNVIVIDIAHGYSDFILDFAKKIKHNLPVKIVLGNTTNTDMIYEADWADALKVGIAQGFACETKNTAGCTEKQYSAVLKFKEISRKLGLPIISDGGIREPADVVKAIGAGANAVMAGKIFAACPESAAETILVDGVLKKVYAGMASRQIQDAWKGGLKAGTCPEGGKRLLDVGESVDNLVERYSGALRSGISYAGGTDIKTFQDSVEFVRF